MTPNMPCCNFMPTLYLPATRNCSVEVVSGAVVAAIAGGSSRRIGISQVREALANSGTYGPAPSLASANENAKAIATYGEMNSKQRSRPTNDLPPPTTNPDIERSQALQLDASVSVDYDDIATIPFDFTWRCESQSGDICVSATGETLNVSSSENKAILSIPENSLPTGKQLEKVPTVANSCAHTLNHFRWGEQMASDFTDVRGIVLYSCLLWTPLTFL